MSNTYLQWAKDNFDVNGLNAGKHEFIREDVLHWLSKNEGRRAKYDLIILDPPTFSNSKRMQDSFEIERERRSSKRAANSSIPMVSFGFQRTNEDLSSMSAFKRDLQYTS